jgi:hypothetical protein
MNGWDLFTWFNCAVLAGTAVVIFGYFLKDARSILTGQRSDVDDGQVDVLLDPDPEPFLEDLAPALEVPDRS